jgi:hypothetical protein
MSEAHDNFTALLRKLVRVSHTELQRRIDDEKSTNDWTEENGATQRRHRLSDTVSRVLASSSRNRS